MVKKRLGLILSALFLATSSIVTHPTQTFKAEQLKEINSYDFQILSDELFDKVQEIEVVENVKTNTEHVAEALVIEEVVSEPIECVEFADDKEYWKFEISYYCGCSQCCDTSTGITASGEYVQAWYTIATPPDIPFYSTVYIEGLGEFEVHDRGGYIQYTYDESGHLAMRVDIYVEDHDTALNLGRHYSDGYIIRN